MATYLNYTTKGGVVVFVHHVNRAKQPAHLPTSGASARLDESPTEATIGTVEADIVSCTACRGFHLTWSKAQGGTSETFPTLKAALARMGEVAVAERAINPVALHYSGQSGCL